MGRDFSRILRFGVRTRSIVGPRPRRQHTDEPFQPVLALWCNYSLLE